jgi:hypothetical protein
MRLRRGSSIPVDRADCRTTEVTWSRPSEAVKLLLRGRTAGTAGPTSAVVGTVLSTVNQGHVILAGHATSLTWVQVVVNYAVPYIVASVGYLSARRVRSQH